MSTSDFVPSDPLADILSVVDARTAISRGFTASGQWGLRMPAPGRLKIETVIFGTAWLILEALKQPLRLQAGDVVIFDGRAAFTLASDPSVEPSDARPIFATTSEPIVHIGEPGAPDVGVVGGHIHLNTAAQDLLLDALPPLLHVHAEDDEMSALQWLLNNVLHEASSLRPGAAIAADHLAGLLLVHVLRTYLTTSPALQSGWLRALCDKRIAPVLRMMHQNPSHPWTLAELAHEGAMSRTAFATRFKQIVGIPPLTYLANWRMRLAERALREDGATVSTLARSLGYTSESAFSHAFKRTYGVAPKRYRDSISTEPRTRTGT